MARIILIQPPQSRAEMYARGAGRVSSVIPPLGLAYLAAVLKRAGHECRIIDGAAESVAAGAVAREAAGYDIAGVTVMSACALRAFELMRELKREAPGLPVVAGGPHVTALPESALDNGADFAVTGEGEQTMLELVEALAAGRRPDGVAGLAFRRDGTPVLTGRRPLIEPLDGIPLPARELLPMRLYTSSIARASAQPSHSMLASRGCPGNCTFCSKLTFGTKPRHFSVERIVEEFFLLRDKYGARDVALYDDNFIADHAIASDVCAGLRRRNLGITWSVQARIDAVTPEIMRELRSAGCTWAGLGIESGSQRILDRINKRITLEQIREAVRHTREAGIQIRGFFMHGFPGETAAEMESTTRFAIELDVDIASFALFTPLPGSAEYRRACESGSFDPEYFLHRTHPDFNMIDEPVYVPEGMAAAELLAVNRSAYRRFFLRPRAVWHRLKSLRSPAELGHTLRGAAALLGGVNRPRGL